MKKSRAEIAAKFMLYPQKDRKFSPTQFSATNFPTVFKEAINLGGIIDKETEKEIKKSYKHPSGV